MDIREKLVELVKLAGVRDKGVALRIADCLVINGVTTQRWILVDDRLPRKEEYTATADDGTEYYVRLLIAYKTDTVEYEIGYYDGYKWMTEMPIRTIKDVVAWMLFPNMPQSLIGE